MASRHILSWKSLCFLTVIGLTFFHITAKAQVELPRIFVQPQNVSVQEIDLLRSGPPTPTASFAVLPYGGFGIPVPTKQWQYMAAGTTHWVNLTDGPVYSGTTTSVLNVVATVQMNGDRFRVVLTNEAGSIASNSASFVVIFPPAPTNLRIVTGNQTGPLGASFEFNIAYDTHGYISYQWYHDNIAIPQATSARLIITDAKFSDAGNYTVRVTNTSGTALSAPVSLTIEQSLGAIVAVTGEDGSGFINGAGELWEIGSHPFRGRHSFGDPIRPLKVMDDVASVAVGANHTLILKADGTLWGVGASNYGQLGLGPDVTFVTTPTYIAADVAFIACGRDHSLFIKTDGSLWGMGSNNFRQLGSPVPGSHPHIPLLISRDVMQVAAGNDHTLVLKTDGSLWGMGHNRSYQLGNTTEWLLPQLTLITNDVKSMAGGTDYSLFIKNDNSLWGMGMNDVGQLGIGSTSRQTPVTHISSDVTALGTFRNSSFFIKIDRTLWAMGENLEYSLGDGTIIARSTPVKIADDVVSVANGRFYIDSAGSLWGWGNNAAIGRSFGGGSQHSPLPVLITRGAVALPRPPSGVTVKTDYQSVRLKWDHTLLATSYEVWRGSQNDVSQATRLAKNISTPFYVDTSAQTDRTYHYWIKAQNVIGTSGFSSIASGYLSSAAQQLNPLYNALLQRIPSVDDYAQYNHALTFSQNLALTTTALIESEEYQARQWELVIRLYLATYSRIPDYAGLYSWSEVLRTGTQTQLDVSYSFRVSKEFMSLFDGAPTHEQFVQVLYRNVLGREADQAGLTNWSHALSTSISREGLLLSFVNSAEFQARLGNTVRIISLYTLLYHRPPTDAELASWKDFLRGLDFTDLFLESAEFQTRFPSGLNNAEYINLMFQGFLRRGVDSAGLSVLTSELQAGITTRAQLLSNITDSQEFATVVAPVIRFYLACLNRTPDIGGLNHWTLQVRSGTSLTGLAEAFALSAEFNSRYGGMTNSQFVAQLYLDTLGRSPDTNGQNHWTHLLNTSAETRASMLLTFANSAEAVERFKPRIRTFLHYSSFLLRSPSKEELDHWDNYLSTLEVQFIEELLQGEEYQTLYP